MEDISISVSILKQLNLYMADRGFKDFIEIKEGRKINYLEFIDLYNYCFIQTEDPNIALHVGELFSPEHWSVLGYLILNCINFRDFFLNMSRYCIILSNYIHITLNEGEEESEIIFTVNSKAEVKDDNCLITAMVNMYRMIEVSLKDKVSLNKVELAVDFSDSEEFFRVFRTYPKSSGKFSLTLSNSYLTAPIPCSDSGILSVFEEHARDIVNLMGTTSYALKLEEVLAGRLSDRLFNIKTAAGILGISDRTLQTRLREEETSYRDILSKVRNREAKKLILEGRDLKEISYNLGFSEVSAFNRFFRRINNISPKAYKLTLN